MTLEALAAGVPKVAARPANTITRGMRVTCKKGTGMVFWIGKAKHGGGIRVGITEDGTGETLWTSESDCRPL